MRVSQVNSGELVFYAGNEMELGQHIKMNYGLRFSNWSNYGEAFSMVMMRIIIRYPMRNIKGSPILFKKLSGTTDFHIL